MARDRGKLAAGFLAVGGGCFILLLAAGAFGEEGKHAPDWIIALCGGVFTFAGLAILVQALGGGSRFSKSLASACGFFVFLSMMIVLHWVAFGPGDRPGSGTISLPFVRISGPGREWTLRAGFGVGAVIMDLALLAIIVSALRRRRREGRAGKPGQEP